MNRLHLLPENGLDRSLHLPIFIGLVFVTLLTETFGWTYAGLVVPGYLAAVSMMAPLTAVLVLGESVISYFVVFLIGLWIPKTGAWSTTFGRERFFLFIITAVLVRIGVEGYVVPAILSRYELAHSRELYSVGLVLVPLTSNVFWNAGFRASAPRLAITTGLTYVLTEYVFARHTNFSLSRMLIANEGGEFDFIHSAKAQLILLLGALLGARGNVLYGWDYNGILVPSLLAVAWYSPRKLVATLVEALLVYWLARFITSKPPFSRMLIVGGRRMLVAFTMGFVVKILIGFVFVRFFPRVELTDYFGFGYLLPALLAVKMWNKGAIGVVIMPAIQVSLFAFVGGNALGYGLSKLGGAFAEDTAASLTLSASTERLSTSLLLGDIAPFAASQDPSKRTGSSNGVAVRAAHALRAGGRLVAVPLEREQAGFLRLQDTPDGKWSLLTPRPATAMEASTGPRVAIRSPWDPARKWVVVLDAPAAGSANFAVAERAAEALDAAAVVVLSRHTALRPYDEELAAALAKELGASRFIVLATDPQRTLLQVCGTLETGFPTDRLRKALGADELVLGWTTCSSSSRDLDRSPRLLIRTEDAERIGFDLLHPPELDTWPGSIRRALEDRVLGLTSAHEEVGDHAQVASLRLYDLLLEKHFSGREPPSEWARALAGEIGYRFAQIGTQETEAWALFEAPNRQRIGLPTVVARRGRRGKMALEVPAPRWESGTLAGALGLWSALDADVILLAGTMPKTLAGGDARIEGVAASFYERAHEVWLDQGGTALSLQGIVPERAPAEPVVLSIGREIASPTEEPRWLAPVRDIFEKAGFVVGTFDGKGSHASLGGGGDLPMAFADRFARDAYAIVWLGPMIRARLVRSQMMSPEALTSFARAVNPLAQDPADFVARLQRCTPQNPAAECTLLRSREARCNLEEVSGRWQTLGFTKNPYDLRELVSNPTCATWVLVPTEAPLPWVLLANASEVRAIPFGVPAEETGALVREDREMRARMALRLGMVRVGIAR